MSLLEFKGSNCFRQRLILSTLSLKSMVIKDIRVKHEEVGLREYELNLLSLIEKLTNGSSYEVDETGTQLTCKPGLLIGGKVEHECSLQRSISYYLEVLLCFAPFCKVPLDVTLIGITNDQIDVSVDSLKHSSTPILIKFLGILDPSEVEIKVISRGLPPNGGGEVLFRCPIRKYLKPVNMLNSGKIKRIRGVAFATRVAPSIANRIVDKAKGYLLKCIPDVYIYTDHRHGKHSGKSPGFGLCLVAETTNEVFYTSDAVSNPSGSEKGVSVPEDVAVEAVFNLFEEIYRGGCFSSNNQALACLFMALGQTDVSKIQLGPLSPYCIQFLRHMKSFLHVTFKLEVDESSEKVDSEGYEYKKGSQKVIATCIGIGMMNLSKTII
ncbi:RNA 3' [Dinothrombium tinctorium]|uniref:RNA 3 n=1 Tax=Dinothrombium tinctorium TaxID=1965070 RepID=A0A3S4QL05_9ACAR|nr:RNA 3' [Dinothrombium tinctorium]RWS04791.1 RNA 3' [Dinothrombium tinctorium]RWS06067.1 RNA 3' [Dinothrombium tinctorium]RWS06216.1 RNA 3' [Dinothrombium tinctorium]